MSIRGKVWKYGDNVDTDAIIPARYLNLSSAAELAAHCMEDIDTRFVQDVVPGDIIVAGKNFGCGSSREHAPVAIKGSGVTCVIAKTFARIFFRNAINIGLPILECPQAVEASAAGQTLLVDLISGVIRNETTGQEFQAAAYPPFMLEIIEAGGLIDYTRQKLMAADGTDQKQEELAKNRLKVAFQGERGAYSEAAALALLGEGITLVPCETFAEVFAAVEDGSCDRGVVPVENSLAGSIHQNYDLLLQHDLYVVGEHNLRVSHCLIAHPGVPLSDIRRVYSHPQALAQCEHSLRDLGSVEVIVAHDTAGSVRLIKERGWRDAAAIAGKGAATLYCMSILRREFEDEKANYTRFIVLSKTPAPIDAGAPSTGTKTSLAFAGKNEPGLLFRSLSAFSLRDIDLTKIESRPLRGVPWEYVFYLDFSGSASEDRCRRALDQLKEMTTFVRVFGSYPRAQAAWVEGE